MLEFALDEEEDDDGSDGDDVDNDDDTTTSLAVELSLTSTDVLFINTAILLMRVWALMSKSSPSSSSSTYRNRKIKLLLNIMKNANQPINLPFQIPCADLNRKRIGIYR